MQVGKIQFGDLKLSDFLGTIFICKKYCELLNANTAILLAEQGASHCGVRVAAGASRAGCNVKE